MFGEKAKEYMEGQELPVWKMPKYEQAKEKAIELINSGKYGLVEADFWILMNQSKKKDKVLYSGLIISHNGCLKINDAMPDYKKFDPDSVTVDKGESEFIAGTTGIFFQDPTVTHLIKVARKCKIMNPDAEFTVLGALTKDAESTDKGFMRNSVATFAACVPESSKQAELIVKYLDWMYSDGSC